MDLQPSREDKANLIAQLHNHKGFEILMEHMKTMFEAHRNELENPKNFELQFTQGRVATYRDIFNYLDEKLKDAKSSTR